MIKERKCNQCGETKSTDKFKKRHHKCISCEEIIERENEEKRLLDELIKSQKTAIIFETELSQKYALLDKLREYIKRGVSNFFIRAALYNERNPPFDLSKEVSFYLIKYLPRFGKTREHINGRENLGVYILHSILIGDITNPEELREFYLMFCVFIFTDDDFNQEIKKIQNASGMGAVLAADYISAYEKYFKIVLSEEVKRAFSKHFISTKYGQITKDTVINHLRRDLGIYV